MEPPVVAAMDRPSPIAVAVSILRVLLTVRRPKPEGSATFDHSMLVPVLDGVADDGIPGAARSGDHLEAYITAASLIDPDRLTRDDALAFWLNLYNAGAIRLAVAAWHEGLSSVLRVPGAFSKPTIEVAGESLSLDSIEHGKIRRFGDPRIHGALVCGSLSCPTLRGSPFNGDELGKQLDDQMRRFMTEGGAVAGSDGVVELSRVFLWYGSDFVRPDSMPTLFPASKRAVLAAVSTWLPDHVRGANGVRFQDYDWGLACTVA